MIRTLVTPETRHPRSQAVMRNIGVLLDTGPVMVTVAEFKPPGTLDQNALFHKLCDHISQWWNGRYPNNGTSPERIKESLKLEYGVIATEYCPLSGQRKARVESWSKYSKKQRADLITATIAWMAGEGIPDLPDRAATEYADDPYASKSHDRAMQEFSKHGN